MAYELGPLQQPQEPRATQQEVDQTFHDRLEDMSGRSFEAYLLPQVDAPGWSEERFEEAK